MNLNEYRLRYDRSGHLFELTVSRVSLAVTRGVQRGVDAQLHGNFQRPSAMAPPVGELEGYVLIAAESFNCENMNRAEGVNDGV